jgi:hypothetical protein
MRQYLQERLRLLLAAPAMSRRRIKPRIIHRSVAIHDDEPDGARLSWWRCESPRKKPGIGRTPAAAFAHWAERNGIVSTHHRMFA